MRRRRATRDLGIIFGIVLILGLLAGANYVFGLGDKVAKFTQMRVSVEKSRIQQGMSLLSWKLVQATEGSRFTAPEYHPDLQALNEQPVNIIGFMTPLDRYRDVSEFLLLPLPLECYFCNMPPMHDVMLVTMAEGETTNLFDDPVMISGTLELGVWDQKKFFYRIKDAHLLPADASIEDLRDLQRKKIDAEHMAPQHGQNVELLQGTEPPKPAEL